MPHTRTAPAQVTIAPIGGLMMVAPTHSMIVSRRTTNLRIGDIAARVGYSSGSNLTRDYRKRFGSSPSRARRRESADGASDPRGTEATA